MNRPYRNIKYDKQKNGYYQGKRDDKSIVIPFYKKFLKQCIICMLIAILGIGIKNIHLPIANRTTEMIKISLTKEMNVKKSFKEVATYVKKIPKMPEKAVSVFNTISGKKNLEMRFIAPIYGEIISNYGEQIDPLSNKKTFQRGVDLSIKQDENINAIADGEIIEIGEGKLGKTIKVRHSKDIFSLYGNCSEIKVKKGQKVKRGESIANIHKSSEKSYAYLHFELWMNGRVVDPTQYISFGKKIL